jgi:hypothetical protein
MSVLDLASGKGELLCTWARDHNIRGTGVDISTLFTSAARARADELDVADRVGFVHGDASEYVAAKPVDVAAGVGATWIGSVVACREPSDCWSAACACAAWFLSANRQTGPPAVHVAILGWRG